MKFVILFFLWLSTFQQDCFAQSAQKVHLDNDLRGRMPVSVFRNAKKLVSSDPSSKVLSATAYFMGTGFPDKDTVKLNGESLKPLKKWMDRAVAGTIIYFDEIKLSANEKSVDAFGVALYEDKNDQETGAGKIMLDVFSSVRMPFVIFRKNTRLVSTNRSAKVISGIAYFAGAGFSKPEHVPFSGDSLSQLKSWMDRCVAGTQIVFDEIKVRNKGLIWTGESIAFSLYGYSKNNADSILKCNQRITYHDIMNGIDPGDIRLDNFSKFAIPLNVILQSKTVLLTNKDFKVVQMNIDVGGGNMKTIYSIHVDGNSLALLQPHLNKFSAGSFVSFRAEVANGKVNRFVDGTFKVVEL